MPREVCEGSSVTRKASVEVCGSTGSDGAGVVNVTAGGTAASTGGCGVVTLRGLVSSVAAGRLVSVNSGSCGGST